MKCAKHASRPELLTQSCKRFFEFDEQLIEFVVFFFRMTQRPDEMLEDLVKFIVESSTDEKVEEWAQGVLKEPRPGKSHIIRFGNLLFENFLVRGTDNFLTYITELLALIFTTRPETLRSAETVKLEEILRHQTMEELVNRLAEKRVERLSYQGMRDLQRDLSEKLNFDLFLKSGLLSRAVQIIEVRNLIVHNRGIVNRMFQARTGDSSIEIGKPLRLRPAAIASDMDFLAKAVIDIDERAATKFGLARSG